MKAKQSIENFSSYTYIKYERLCLTIFTNTEKRVENMTCSRVFLMIFKVFGNVVKHCLECLIQVYIFSTET